MKKYVSYLAVMLAIVVCAFYYSNELIIKGKIVDDKGIPVSNVSIWVKGSHMGTTSDTAGNFTIKVPDKKAILLISSIGYAQQQVQAGSGKSLSIKLTPLTNTLDEVVATAFLKAEANQAAMKATQSKMMRLSAPSMLYDRQYIPEANNRNVKGVIQDSISLDREGYDGIVENPFVATGQNPLSTFSIDVDAASYSNIRRMLNYNQLPPAGAVRIEEMINYFSYKYPQPKANEPFSINTEIASCPWNVDHRLVSIGLQGKKIPVENLPPSNLTFLIDVSGSMQSEDKLPLVKSSLKLLVSQLREQDMVSIVVYAGRAGLVLEPTSGDNKAEILAAIQNLEAGGSTAGGQGIQLAYKTAEAHFYKQGNNRVILCTDGDFNVGISSDDGLERLIEEKRKSGIFLTVLGFGTGNYQDAKMQKLADKGNGNHAYIDNQNEAKKVLVSEFGGTLFTIAKDVKLQIEFNPALVRGYRLIGYENRMLAKEDFNNDKKDAGELGSGHTVTALYEIIPAGIQSKELHNVDDLKYQKPLQSVAGSAFSGELMNIKLRYKQPDSDVSKLLVHPVKDNKKLIENASDNLRFAAAVAQFGMLLRNSEYKGDGGYALVFKLAASALNSDSEGYRKEFLQMVKKAEKLSSKDVSRIGEK